MRNIHLPSRSTIAPPPPSSRVSPALVSLGLIGLGALLWRSKPSLMDMPDPVPLGDHADDTLLRRAARRSRDGVSRIAPGNLGVSLGRSMVVAGAAMLLTRLLDEIASDD
ncbi:hypothetical protein [Oceaniglobus roseus]|uniref:hypothetical protein n=1 Tax=Oceaniglobus roseus TaxID=1737570 RepID=UPI000C7F2A05|nr:hypothetical protein [Kandeliimicrobium roseum]